MCTKNLDAFAHVVAEIQNKRKLPNYAHALWVLGTQFKSAYLDSVCGYDKKQW